MNLVRSVKVVRGPLATVYVCPRCPHTVRVPRGVPGVGRAYGLSSASTARAAVVAHIRSTHEGGA